MDAGQVMTAGSLTHTEDLDCNTLGNLGSNLRYTDAQKRVCGKSIQKQDFRMSVGGSPGRTFCSLVGLHFIVALRAVYNTGTLGHRARLLKRSLLKELFAFDMVCSFGDLVWKLSLLMPGLIWTMAAPK